MLGLHAGYYRRDCTRRPAAHNAVYQPIQSGFSLDLSSLYDPPLGFSLIKQKHQKLPHAALCEHGLNLPAMHNPTAPQRQWIIALL